jgi:outer membrane protein W
MRKTGVLAIAIFLAAAGWTHASIRVGVMGGYALTPDKNYGEAVAYGVSVGLDLGKYFCVELSGLRFQYPVTTATTEGLSKGSLATLPVELSLKARFSSGGLAPYLSVGAGYYLNHFSLDSTVASGWEKVGFEITEKVDNVVGFHAAAGLELALSPTAAVCLEVRYCFARPNGSWQISDTGSGQVIAGDLKNLNLDSIIFNLGFAFSFK